jgi:aminoglycoside phosphotransferase (APT) family kinase protein
VQPWTAEIVVDERLARALIGGQFPGIHAHAFRLLAEGWDNTVWVVDDRFAFRFPRRDVAVPLVGRELAVLPVLEPLLPVPVPVPVFEGRPAHGYPWPFLGAYLLPGGEAAGLDEAVRLELVRPLATVLRALHSDETRRRVEAVYALPADPNRRADTATRAALARRQLAEVERLGLWRAPASVEQLLEEGSRLAPAAPSAVTHGDLHFRHVLVGADGAIGGVIDWGDVCLSDPAIDLQLVWSFFPPEGRASFLEAYGPVTEEQLLRARVVALSLCSALAAYGRHEGHPLVEREALAGLRRATA